jgi:hypothetical protein
MAKANDTFQIWHGARRWDGEPEIRQAKAGRAESGTGIYGTTHFDTTAPYRKGGGKAMLLTIQATHVLEKTCIPLDEAINFLKRNISKAKQGALIADCTRNADRVKDIVLDHHDCVGTATADTVWLPAAVLRNLLVDSDLGSGAAGVKASQFFASMGIGLSIERAGSHPGEQWVVIFDPQLIVDWKPHTYESALEVGHELPAPDAHTTDPVEYLRPLNRYGSYNLGR